MGGGHRSAEVHPATEAQRIKAANEAEGREKLCGMIGDFAGERMRVELQAACRRIAADGGKALATTFLQTLPKTMFLFLPVVALVLYGLFFRVRRFFVAHLVFALHYQAAMFSLFTLIIFVDKVSDWLVLPVLGYTAWYTWRSLRAVYGQGWFLTAFKMWMFGFAYSVLLGFTLLGTVIVSALKG
jgi:hypothetical protein